MISFVGEESVGQRSLAFIQRALDLLRSTVREIFDESAYERFLERRDVTSSPGAYAEFLREGQAARERRPRCC